MNKPLVSFLIALYNKEKYIKECVESCLNQNYVNIEVCVVDDGSTDNSLKIVREYFGGEVRVKIHSFDKNKGKVAAYNKAFELSNGEYFAFVGADDVNTPDRVNVLLSELINAKVNLTYGNLLQTDEKLNVQKRFDGITSKVSNKRILRNNFISGGCSLFDIRLANEVFPISENIKFEDWWVSLLAVLFYRVKFVNIDVGLYRLNESNDNLSSENNISFVIARNKKLYERDFIIYDKLKDYLKIKKSNKIRTIQNYIELNCVYKKNYIESNVKNRFSNFSSIRFLALNRWYFEAVMITLFGSKLDFLKKKIKQKL